MRLAGLAAALALASLPAGAAAQEVPIALNPGEVLLNVQADGEYRSRPDVMTVTAGVVTTPALRPIMSGRVRCSPRASTLRSTSPGARAMATS